MPMHIVNAIVTVIVQIIIVVLRKLECAILLNVTVFDSNIFLAKQATPSLSKFTFFTQWRGVILDHFYFEISRVFFLSFNINKWCYIIYRLVVVFV